MRPVFLLGNGIRKSDAVDECRKMIERLGVPVVYTPTASDIYGSANTLSIGSIGSLGGTREGNFVLQNAFFICCKHL